MCDPNFTPMPDPPQERTGGRKKNRNSRDINLKRAPMAPLLFSAAGGDTRGYLSTENRTLSFYLAFGIISSYEVRYSIKEQTH